MSFMHNDYFSYVGLPLQVLHEYEIISRNSNIHRGSGDDNGDENDAVANGLPIVHHQSIDAVSTSEPEFPKLFHQRDDSSTSESLSLIQQPTSMRHDPLYADWLVNDNKSNTEVQNMYRKVANWVFSQQRFLHNTASDGDDDDDDDPSDVDNDYDCDCDLGDCHEVDDATGGIFMDEMEMIDPIDLFDDYLLHDFLLLTRSSSEKRILLREFSHYTYNMLTVKEAMKSCDECHYLKKPDQLACFEMSEIASEEDTVQVEKEQPFLTVETVLEDYACYDQEGAEIAMADSSLGIDDAVSSSDEGSSIKEEDDTENKDMRSNELEIVSYHYSDVEPQNLNSDDCTSVTYPTDAFDISTALVADIISQSDENESDVWEDAKGIPHWLDFETEDHLFTQPHRPFYYYRDRIKGCYRIIGVEDETVVLFSGNDDDSIFYGCDTGDRNVRDISALRRSHSLGLLNSSLHKSNDAFLSKPTAISQGNAARSERRNDSGIEDVEDSIVDETLIETALSAKECHEMGRVTKVIRTKGPKTVNFKLDSARPLRYNCYSAIFVVFCLFCTVILFVLTMQS